MSLTTIAVKVNIDASVDTVWTCWNSTEDIKSWNHANHEWHTPIAMNDLRPGGSFNYRMESRDGRTGFDFSGVYTEVIKHKLISYTLEDGRKVIIEFRPQKDRTTIIETFEADRTNSLEMQRQGWQAILNNFKKYAEN